VTTELSESQGDISIDLGELDVSEPFKSEGVPNRYAELSLSAKIEAIMFASPKPIRLNEIYEFLQDGNLSVKKLTAEIESIKKFYDEKQGGFRLEHIRGLGFQFRTVPDAAPLMEKMFAERPRPLSRAAQETLAIIAYRQPVTRADIEFIRGVDAGSILKNLLDREMIKCVGRKEIAGKPMIFGTTEEFLRIYGLESLGSLPPLESFQPQKEVIREALRTIDEAALSESEGGDAESDELI
jgi:segregation and condensation protein B